MNIKGYSKAIGQLLRLINQNFTFCAFGFLSHHKDNYHSKT